MLLYNSDNTHYDLLVPDNSRLAVLGFIAMGEYREVKEVQKVQEKEEQKVQEKQVLEFQEKEVQEVDEVKKMESRKRI